MHDRMYRTPREKLLALVTRRAARRALRALEIAGLLVAVAAFAAGLAALNSPIPAVSSTDAALGLSALASAGFVALGAGHFLATFGREVARELGTPDAPPRSARVQHIQTTRSGR